MWPLKLWLPGSGKSYEGTQACDTSQAQMCWGVSLFLSIFPWGPISEHLFLSLHLPPKSQLISQFTSTDLSSRVDTKQLPPLWSDLKRVTAHSTLCGLASGSACPQHGRLLSNTKAPRTCIGEVAYGPLKWPSGCKPFSPSSPLMLLTNTSAPGRLDLTISCIRHKHSETMIKIHYYTQQFSSLRTPLKKRTDLLRGNS